MNRELAAKWSAAARTGEPIKAGDVVVCDFCGADYTERQDTGGLLFQSRAVCPECAPKIEADAERWNETRYIRARCPQGKSFADWIRELRGPDSVIRIVSL